MSYQPITDPTNSRAFRQEAIQLALSHAPSIFPCAHCLLCAILRAMTPPPLPIPHLYDEKPTDGFPHRSIR